MKKILHVFESDLNKIGRNSKYPKIEFLVSSAYLEAINSDKVIFFDDEGNQHILKDRG